MPALRLPGVQTEVVVVPAGGDERGLVAELLHLLEAEHVTVERERALDVAHLQVNVTDVHARDRSPSAVKGTGASAIPASAQRQ